MKDDALHILKRYWGHKAFRSLQEEIILSAAQNKDVVALLPTGGGKSLCFQVPALLQEGICIVISPLIALMQDQVNALQEKGIKAMALTSGISYKDLDTMLDNCVFGNYKFLYLSPERLQQEIVQERIKRMNVNLIAVDEAHCISQWGHDFRPSYRSIATIRELQPTTSLIALTATATKIVVQDIIEQLKLKNAAVFQKSFERKNIAYNVVEAHDKNYHLLQLLQKYQGSLIIYVRSRNATIRLANFLEGKNISAAAFHGGMSIAEKEQKLKQWISEEKKVIVATNAFGMGIDKADVRCIIHYNLPESIESYFQEAGRAGRDEKPAEAIILTNEADIPKLKTQFLSALPSAELVQQVYKKLNSYFGIAYGEGFQEKYDFDFSDFCHVYNFKTLPAYNAISYLDRSGIITLSKEFHQKPALQFIIPNNQLLYYLDQNEKLENFTKIILRTYGGIYENKIEIDLKGISKKAGIKSTESLKLLKKLSNDGVIDYSFSTSDSSITFLKPREDEKTINPILPFLKLQNKSKSDKIEDVLTYIKNEETCRSVQLLQYFGETTAKACGICSVCTSETEKLTNKKIKSIFLEIEKILEEEELTSRKIVEKLKFSEAHVLEVLKLLLAKEIVSLTASKKYKLTRL